MIEEIRPLYGNGLPQVRLAQAAVGDVFFQVQPMTWGGGVRIARYVVKRVLPSEVICFNDTGPMRRFRRIPPVGEAFANEADPQLQALIQAEQARQLKARASRIAEIAAASHGVAIDDDLLQALLAFERRCEARQGTPPSA